MEPRITGREVICFILMFDLWDSYLDATMTYIPNGGIDFRKHTDDGLEYSYVLFCDGRYEIELWRNESDDEVWKPIKSGNIFKEMDANERNE